MQLMMPRAFTEDFDTLLSTIPDEHRKMWCLAQQLSAWGCCHAGQVPPNFGDTMVKLGAITGALTDNECLNLAKDLKPQSP